jgi:hypothetical protein
MAEQGLVAIMMQTRDTHQSIPGRICNKFGDRLFCREIAPRCLFPDEASGVAINQQKLYLHCECQHRCVHSGFRPVKKLKCPGEAISRTEFLPL